MARYAFKLPDIGEGIAEAEIVAWHVKVGDEIAEDQQIADMMTDKATVEMESPVAGVVKELAGEVGDQVAIGSVLAVIETDGAAVAPESKEERPLGDGAFHLDRRLVGHHVGDLLIFRDRVADLDVPGDDLRLGNAFADVRQLEFVSGHYSVMTFSRARFMRFGPGK